MSNIFKPKRSNVAASIPSTSNLADGELAVNSADRKIYLRDNINIIEVANGEKYWILNSVGIHTLSNVGIGTTNPTSKLQVLGDVNISGVTTATSFSGSGINLTGIVTSIVAGTNVTISGSTGQVTINASGGGGGGSIGLANTTENSTYYVGIANTSTGNLTTLNVSTTGLTFNPSTGNLVAGGTVTANSDISLKTNIKTIENALDKVLSLRGVEFDRIDNGDNQIGVIAQEIEQIIPQVVYPKQHSSNCDKKSVAYANLIGLLIEAIKELNDKIENN